MMMMMMMIIINNNLIMIICVTKAPKSTTKQKQNKTKQNNMQTNKQICQKLGAKFTTVYKYFFILFLVVGWLLRARHFFPWSNERPISEKDRKETRLSDYF